MGESTTQPAGGAAVDDETRSAALPRWRGAAGRLEVWYATLSDPLTRTGLWVHCETVAPTTGGPY
ncbi:hypothetical protein DSK46_04690, partial [Mycobacterium tuberculosis]